MVHPSEKVDPAHWVQMFGGTVMLTVCMACATGLWLPWWTLNVEKPGISSQVEVGLWIRATRIELQADDSTLNCKAQCDSNRLGGTKIRETSVHWGDFCAGDNSPETEDMGNLCFQLWVVRLFVLVCWFSSLLFCAFSYFNFCGAGQPGTFRIPPSWKIVLGIGCLICNILSLVIAHLMIVRLEAVPPGTLPPIPDPTLLPRVPLNGFGFLGQLASTILSCFGVGTSYLAQYVVNHLDDCADMEAGREMADVNKGPSPCLEHQVQAEWHHHIDEEAKKEWKPEPVKLGNWMNN